jgi:hypothetical protein
MKLWKSLVPLLLGIFLAAVYERWAFRPSATVSATSKAASLAGYSGNGLVNFFDASLVTKGHKQFFYVGNSTVWGASGYFGDMCNEMGSTSAYGAFLVSIGLTRCATNISGYRVLDNDHHLQVSFTDSVPAGYEVGDLILSEPTNPSLIDLTGEGIITAIGSTTINYTLLPLITVPTKAISFTPSGGYVSNSLVNLGAGGATAPATGSYISGYLKSYVHSGDLVLVRGPLINDVRQGACDLGCAIARIQNLYSLIVADIPSDADIAWKTENSLLTADPTRSGLVVPLASSQAYTAILHDAVFQAFRTLPPRVVVWDNMQMVFSRVGKESATSPLMKDIVHPSVAGQVREAASDLGMLRRLHRREREAQAGQSLPVPWRSEADGPALTVRRSNGIGLMRRTSAVR